MYMYDFVILIVILIN